MDENKPIVPPREYAVVLPCPPEDFGRFVSALLGKPQTIQKRFDRPFVVAPDDVTNTFHLVDQRIRQQNEAVLVQFNVTIGYADGSSVLLSSLDDFSHYREIPPLVSTSVELSWVYLIRFTDRKIPEKQEIDLLFSTERDEPIIRRYHQRTIHLQIRHTARSWGNDIASLLSAHVASLTTSESRLKRFLVRHHESLGLAVGTTLFLITMIGVYRTTTNVLRVQEAAARNVQQLNAANVAALSARVDFLIDQASKGIWPRTSLILVTALVIAVVLATFAGAWVISVIPGQEPAFVLISAAAVTAREEYLRWRQRRWWKAAVLVVVSVAAGVGGNIIFAAFFSKWFR